MGLRARLFVAIEPCAETRAILAEDVSAARRVLPKGWRWVRPESIHLTLRFLGETDASRVDALASSLAKTAASSSPFEIALSADWGAFPNARRARVLWRALSGELEALAGVAASVELWARGAGYQAEERAFRAHVTLARADRRARPAPLDLGRLPARAGHAFKVDALVLYKSELGEGGARYEALSRAALGTKRDDEENLS